MAITLNGTTGVATSGSYENAQTIGWNYTVTVGSNAGFFGPITVADGITVSIPNGSYLSIV